MMEDMAKRGQPPKYGDVAASKQLSARVLESDHKRWAAEAERQGVPLTEWVVKTLNAALPRRQKKNKQ